MFQPILYNYISLGAYFFLLKLELRRLPVVQLHGPCVQLYNSGHSYSKNRVGKKRGVRDAERHFPQRHQDGDCQVASGPIV